MEQCLYLINFKDGSMFTGGNYINTKWTEIPNKSIKRLIYNLPNGDSLVFNGKDVKFARHTEVCVDLNGKKAGKKQLEKDYLLIDRKNIIDCYEIDLKTKEVKLNKYYEDDMYMKSLNLRWI